MDNFARAQTVVQQARGYHTTVLQSVHLACDGVLWSAVLHAACCADRCSACLATFGLGLAPAADGPENALQRAALWHMQYHTHALVGDHWS